VAEGREAGDVNAHALGDDTAGLPLLSPQATTPALFLPRFRRHRPDVIVGHVQEIVAWLRAVAVETVVGMMHHQKGGVPSQAQSVTLEASRRESPTLLRV